jgi:hypothetical protein
LVGPQKPICAENGLSNIWLCRHILDAETTSFSLLDYKIAPQNLEVPRQKLLPVPSKVILTSYID